MIAGAVLTGGASRRMGTDKATLVVAGRPMAVTVAEALRGAGCDPVLAVGGPEGSAGEGVTVVPDAVGGVGPAGGVLGAMSWLVEQEQAGTHPAVEWVVIAACDLPGLTAADVRPIVDAVGAATGERAVDVVVAEAGGLQPSLAAWRLRSLPQLRVRVDSGVHALRELIATLPATTVRIPARALRNVNTPHDLRRYAGDP